MEKQPATLTRTQSAVACITDALMLMAMWMAILAIISAFAACVVLIFTAVRYAEKQIEFRAEHPELRDLWEPRK